MAERSPERGADIIRRRMIEVGITQEQLGIFVAEELGEEPVGQPGVARWLKVPDSLMPERVFAIERVLDLPPGSLSQHWGYLPLSATGAATVEEAIAAEPWPETVKAGLLANVAAVRASLANNRHRWGR